MPKLPPNFRPFILTTNHPTKELLCELAALHPVYLDVPAHFPQEFFVKLRHQFPDVQLIASYHDYEKTGDNLEEIFKQLLALRPDLIKIATFAQSSVDGLKMLLFLKKHAKRFPMTAF